MTYELTSIRFQLAEIQFLPFAQEQNSTNLDLLNGSTIMLSAPRDARLFTGLLLRFNNLTAIGKTTFALEGNFVTMVNGERIIIPLSIVFADEIFAETAIAGSDAGIEE